MEHERQKNANSKDLLVLKLLPADNVTSDYVLTLPQRSNPWLSFTTLLKPKVDQKCGKDKTVNDILRYLAQRWRIKKR